MSKPEATKVPRLLKATVTTELVAEAQLDNKTHLYRHQVKHTHACTRHLDFPENFITAIPAVCVC